METVITVYKRLYAEKVRALLATQKLISTYSKATHFNTHDPNVHIPETSHSVTQIRDEIGLLHAIAVKVRPSVA
jgi:hypothetical protein